jgi:UDP-N-acetylglucosamine diphosphorylase / glucose-1-phosphate thymidylyltransferase / UDP-N-acetylgalactosamine diphosphorylase / glucosamine-1-phosphate N-acetyltransferase / galactosamine-1-phosphate N-acetyltransferase
VDRVKQAVILAAGEGQRLKPFTALKPKVMLPIANKPILQYVIEALAANGVFQVIIVVGYRKEQVQDYFGSGERFGVDISYVAQEQQLGTGHALRQAKDMAEGRFIVLSGDNIIEPDTLSSFVEADAGSILLKEQTNTSKYGVATVKGGLVADIAEKPEKAESFLVNTGVYIFDRQVFSFLEEEVDLVQALKDGLKGGYRLSAAQTPGRWLDVVYPWDMLVLNDRTLRMLSPSRGGKMEAGVAISGVVSVGKGTIIRSHTYIMGPAIIGENCEIGPSVCLLPSTSLGRGVVVSPFTLIENSVINNNVEIGPNSTVVDSIIDYGCVFKGNFMAYSGEAEVKIEGEHHSVKMGAMVGEYCRVGEGVSVQAGRSLGTHCQVGAGKIISTDITGGGLVI